MHKTITILLCLFICFNVSAQKLKKVKQLTQDGTCKEIFTVDKNTLLKQGDYAKLRVEPWTLLEKGTFEMGMQQGNWHYYITEDLYWVKVFDKGETNNFTKLCYKDKVCARGKMVDGVKQGVWNFWDYILDDRILIYDFDKQEVLWANDMMKFDPNILGDEIYNKDGLVEMKGTRAFVYGGDGRLKDELEKIALYPLNDRNEPIKGKAVLMFKVAKNGEVHSPKIIESSNILLEEEMLRQYDEVIRHLQWFPATVNGEPVDFQYLFPYDFTGKEVEKE